jgi:crotonobetainyl-CoA:carnitine CoA-transferase CaiB-like acyl-CoA transferase
MCVEDDAGREHLGTPLKFAHEPAGIDFAAPAHGAHTDAVLRELGRSEAAIARLRAEGVV